MVELGRLFGAKLGKQFGADTLKSLFQQIQAIAKCLIRRQVRKPVCPVIFNQIVDLLFIEFAVQMSEKPDTDEFLIGKPRLSIITKTLKTSCGTAIVNLTDKQIKF